MRRTAAARFLQPLPLVQLLLLLFSRCLCVEALSVSTVITRLPGFHGSLPFHLETGYVGVDDVNDVQLFYYFIPSEGNPKEDPLLLWLTGGPGCSAFSGLVFEIGPLKFRSVKYNGSLPSLVYFPQSWTKVSNIIFLDSPVGTGFSYSGQPEGYIDGDITSCKRVVKFLRKWLLDHPQYLSNPLYIAGDSYAGKVVPIIAYEILQGLESGDPPSLNLKGYVIGNPGTGERIDTNSQVPYAHNMAIISDELYQSTMRHCEGEDHTKPTTSPLCDMCMKVVEKFFSEIDKAHILEPNCPLASPNPDKSISERSLQQEYPEFVVPPPLPSVNCRSYAYYLSYYWANSDVVREALEIHEGIVPEWQRCSHNLSYAYDIPSSIKYHNVVTSRGYRALVYSGDHDLIIPHIGTHGWIKSLNFSIVDDWRSWSVGGQVAGYTRTFSNNLTFATVKGAGHTAPEYKPKECLAMIRRWLSYKPL